MNALDRSLPTQTSKFDLHQILAKHLLASLSTEIPIPPRVGAGQEVGRRASARLLLVVDVGERLPVVITDDEAGVGFLSSLRYGQRSRLMQ